MFPQVPWSRLGLDDRRDTQFAASLATWEAIEQQHSEQWVGLQQGAVAYGMRMVLLGLAEDSGGSETWNRVNLWGPMSDALFRGIPFTEHGR